MNGDLLGEVLLFVRLRRLDAVLEFSGRVSNPGIDF